jgi:hypothetical protein
MVETQNGGGPEQNHVTPAFRTLAELEQVVKEGLATYQEVGNALDEIKSRGLYKETHQTFEAYLKEKWGISRAHGYRLIAAAQVAKMSPIGDKPANEHLARKRAMSKQLAKTVKTAPPSCAYQLAKFKKLLDEWKKLDSKLFLQLLGEVDHIVHPIIHPDEDQPELGVAA